MHTASTVSSLVVLTLLGFALGSCDRHRAPRREPVGADASTAMGWRVAGPDEIIRAGALRTTPSGHEEALLWTQAVPSPGTAALLGLGSLLAMRRRR